METPTRPLNCVAIASHPSLPASIAEAKKVCRFMTELGIPSVECHTLNDPFLRSLAESGNLDLMIALGGDGTMLRAGRLCGPLGVPILGINVGRFGFLAEMQRDEWHKLLPRLKTSEYWMEDHMMLHVEHVRSDAVLATWNALNEVVVCRGQFVRPITLKAIMDGYLLSSYVADGLIAATPTGSTAYALAAGGPILPPEARNILIVPVAPHLSQDRTIVLPEGAKVTIRAHTNHDAVLSVDGQPPVVVQDGDDVRVTAAGFSVSFIRFQDPGYFYHNLNRYMEQNPTTGGADER